MKKNLTACLTSQKGFTLLELYARRAQARANAGFTLLELMVVFSVIVLLTGVGFASFASYSKKQVLNQAVQDLKTGIDEAKFNAVSRIKPAGCIGSLDRYRLRVSVGSDLYDTDAACVTGISTSWTAILASKRRPGTVTTSMSGECMKCMTNGCMQFFALTGIDKSCGIVVSLTDGSASKTICVDTGGNASIRDGFYACPP